MEVKICSRCNLEKNSSEFGKHKRSKDGLRYECNLCHSLESKKYREDNPEKIISIRKKHYELNKENILNSGKVWRSENRDKVKTNKKEWKLNNSIKYQEYLKNWRSENREMINNYKKLRNNSNPIFKIIENSRSRVRNILKSNNITKKHKTLDIIGCTPEFLRNYIESQFIDGMSWENYGYYGWHIDHKIPLSLAKNEEEVYKLCHYTNLQPLWAEDNFRKNNTYITN
jgi:hypothetical protein